METEEEEENRLLVYREKLEIPESSVADPAYLCLMNYVMSLLCLIMSSHSKNILFS